MVDYGETHENVAEGLVKTRFDEAHNYADTSFNLTQNYVDDLQSLLKELKAPENDGLTEIDLPSITPIDYTARPTLGKLKWSDREATPPGYIEGYNDIEEPDLTGLDGLQPIKDFKHEVIQRENLDLPDAPDSVKLNDIDIPKLPELEFPDAPELETIEFPEPLEFDLGEFNAQSPGNFIMTSPDAMIYEEGIYTSQLATTLVELIGKGFASSEVYEKLILDSSTDSLDSIINKLLDAGSSGINKDVEQLIYNRGKARQQVENDRLYQQVTNEFGATGFNLPSGIFAAKVAELHQETSRKTDQLSYEIILQQANLAQQNKQFMLDKAIQLEGMLKNFFNQQSNRTLEAAKAVALHGIQLLQAQIQVHNLKLDLYKSEAFVFELKTKAELNAIEIFKGQLQGAAIKAGEKKNQVALFQLQIATVETKYNAHKTAMEGVKLAMEIEGLKLEQFGEATQLYLAGIEAEKLKVDINKEQNEVEKIKSETYLSDIQAFRAKVEIKKIKIDADIASKELMLKENSSLVAKYQADLQKYQAQLQSEANINDRELRAFQVSTTTYNAETEAVRSVNMTKIEELRTKIQKAQLESQNITAEMQLEMQGYVALKDLQVKGTEGIMNVGAQLAASAMNAVNASATYGFGSSYSASDSESESLTTTHTYNHSD